MEEDGLPVPGERGEPRGSLQQAHTKAIPARSRALLDLAEALMPVESKSQWRLMQAIAHGWRPRRKKGPSMTVAKEFVAHGKPKGLPERKGTR